MSAVIITILTLLTILLMLIIIGSFYFYHMAIARADKGFLDSNPDLEVSESIEVPLEDSQEWWNEQSFSDWSITSDDGLLLQAYYLEASEETHKTVILAHGYSGSAGQMGNLARMYHKDLGFNVLIPDARGHGRSEGDYIGFGWAERRDYLLWISKVVGHTEGEAQIVLHGVSMGAATVMMTGGEELPSNVKAIVEDCGYTSVQDQLAYQLKRMYKLPAFPMIQSTSLLTKARAGYYFGEASALKQVKKSKTPMLFIHGSEDLFVPTWMVHELYENAPVEKEIFIVQGAGHGLARAFDPKGYDRKVSHFIGRYMK